MSRALHSRERQIALRGCTTVHFDRPRSSILQQFRRPGVLALILLVLRRMSNDENSKRPEQEPAPAPAAKRAQPGEELSDEELESVAGGAVDTFAKIGDIKGESMDTKHKGEIEIESFSWGVSPIRK